MNDAKQFLYAWLGKQQKVPEYEIQTINNKNRQRFKCDLRVKGFNYVGIGNSTNKKDSQTNAALDFCQFLVRVGHLNQQDLPKLQLEGNDAATSQGSCNIINNQPLPRGIIAPHQSMGINFNENSNYQNQILPYKRGPDATYMAHINQMGNRQMLEQAEETDANSEMHGNWQIDNAKSRLHGFLQMNKISVDYKYKASGLDNNRSYFAEMSFYVRSINKKIYANE